jgi:uncharacterized protein YbaP (TraB family)
VHKPYSRGLHIVFLLFWGLQTRAWAETPPPFGQGILFEVRGPEGQVNQVLGTYHGSDPELLNLPAPVRSALDASRVLVLEMLPDPDLTADLAGLMRLAQQEYAGSDTALMRHLPDLLLDSRNRLMAERLQPRLAQGGVFVAVGALHLPGSRVCWPCCRGKAS